MSNSLSLSLIIPAFNEEKGIKQAVFTNLHSLQNSSIDFEIIVIDDGSKDLTKSVLEENFKNCDTIKLYSKNNGGFGSAIKMGIEYSAKKYVIFAPVDNPLTEEILNIFLSNIGKADILVSYRTLRKGYSYRMKFNSMVYHFLISTLFGLRLKDYNWIHLYKKEIFTEGISIEYNGIFMLAEVLIKSKKKGHSFFEFPVEMKVRETGIQTAASFSSIWRTFKDMFGYFFRAL